NAKIGMMIVMCASRGEQTGKAHERQRQSARDDEHNTEAAGEIRHARELRLLADRRHEHERECQTEACADREEQSLCEAVAAIRLEDREAEDRAVGRDQWQEDAELAEQRRAQLLYRHLYDLYQRSDDDNERND